MRKKIIEIIMFLLISINVIIIIYNYYDNNKSILIVGSNTIIEYKNNKISKIKQNTSINKRFNYKKFNVYNDGSFEECYIDFSKYSDDDSSYIVYDSGLQEIELSNNLIAYTGNLNISIENASLNYEMNDNDQSIIERYLNEEEYNLDELNFSKVEIDMNNDSKKETIYTINNFNSIESSNTTFCYVFLVDNGNIIDIKREKVNSSKYYIINASSFSNAIDIDNDGKYEIVLSSYYDESTPYYEFYKYENGKITEIK